MYNKDNTTIFSIDMNNGFAKAGNLYSERIGALIEPTVEFFKSAKEKGIKIIGVTDTHLLDALEFSSYPPHCVLGTEECEIVDELKIYMDEIISKNSTNAFFSVPISYKEAHNYIITGCCTDICIYQYAVTLIAYFNENGIDSNVIVIKPLVDTFNMEGHDADAYNLYFINSMVAAGVQIAEEAPLFI